MSKFVAVMHVFIESPDEVGAIVEADRIQDAIERRTLSEDDEESCEVVQVIPLDEPAVPSASIYQLKRARNILIRTRTKEGFDLGRALDQHIHAMAQRLHPEEAMTNYDWSSYIHVAEQVFNGGNPL